MLSNALDLLTGWSTGFQFTQSNTWGNEVRQGKSYYLFALSQASQTGQLGTLVNKIVFQYPASPLKLPAQIFANIAPLASIPLLLFSASVKLDHYEGFAKTCNSKWNNSKRISWIPIRLPEKFGNRTVRVINFLAEHTGNIIQMAMITASVALIALGTPYFGASVLVALSYEAIDSAGLLPRKISLFMETYMPITSIVGVAIVGSTVVRVFSLLALSTYLSSSFSRFIHQRIDLIAHKCFNLSGPTLQDIDAPLVTNNKLTYAEINEILDAADSDYRINPAHSSKWVNGSSEFPVNNKFSEYLTLFDTVDWTKQYTLVVKRLKDDEIFIDFLHTKKFPKISLEDLKKDFDHYIETLASLENISKERYAANYLREQMKILVSVLKGEKRVKGSQKDLADGMSDLSKVLAYLGSIQKSDPCEFEDVLVKLATEGGDYCARGIKRAAGELTNNIFQRGSQSKETDSNPIKDFELKIGRSLQDLRMSIVQLYYKEILTTLGSIPDAITTDVHSFDIYRLALSLGFYPLTDYERNKLGIGDVCQWEIFTSIRKDMYKEYESRLTQVIKENGEIHFANYINQLINTNPNLSPAQKEYILERYIGLNKNCLQDEDVNQKNFQRLLFVMLGVLHRSNACSRKSRQ